MGIVHVQDVNLHGLQGSATIPFTISSTAGNTLVMSGSWYAGNNFEPGISSITDSSGTNAWSYSTSDAANPPSQHILDGGNYYGVFVGWCTGAAAVTSVTLTLTQSVNPFINVNVSEWSGILQADTGAVSTGASDGNGDAPSGTLALAGSGELVIGAADAGGAGLTAQPAGMSEFTANAVVYNCYQTGASGSFTGTWAGAGSSQNYVTALAGFLPLPAPPAVAYSMRMFP